MYVSKTSRSPGGTTDGVLNGKSPSFSCCTMKGDSYNLNPTHFEDIGTEVGLCLQTVTDQDSWTSVINRNLSDA